MRFAADKEHDKVHRRTLYTFIKRTAPPPQMSIVDAPSRESCVVRRERTNTPLLALMLFNDPQYVEAARALAQRTMREVDAGNPERAEHMFRLCTGRVPTHVELYDLVEGFNHDWMHYQAHPEDAARLVAVGSSAADEKLDVAELAAWTMTANMLLCTDEVVNKN